MRGKRARMRTWQNSHLAKWLSAIGPEELIDCGLISTSATTADTDEDVFFKNHSSSLNTSGNVPHSVRQVPLDEFVCLVCIL